MVCKLIMNSPTAPIIYENEEHLQEVLFQIKFCRINEKFIKFSSKKCFYIMIVLPSDIYILYIPRVFLVLLVHKVTIN